MQTSQFDAFDAELWLWKKLHHSGRFRSKRFTKTLVPPGALWKRIPIHQPCSQALRHTHTAYIMLRFIDYLQDVSQHAGGLMCALWPTIKPFVEDHFLSFEDPEERDFVDVLYDFLPGKGVWQIAIWIQCIVCKKSLQSSWIEMGANGRCKARCSFCSGLSVIERYWEVQSHRFTITATVWVCCFYGKG